MALGRFGTKKGSKGSKKGHVTARVMVTTQRPRAVTGWRSGDEVTMRGATHKQILDQALRKMFGNRIPYDCKVVYGKPRKLPSGHVAGADAHVMCDVATIYTSATRNKKRGRRLHEYRKSR